MSINSISFSLITLKGFTLFQEIVHPKVVEHIPILVVLVKILVHGNKVGFFFSFRQRFRR